MIPVVFLIVLLSCAAPVALAPVAAPEQESAAGQPSTAGALALAERAGAWVVELTTVQGLTSQTDAVAVSSSGEMLCNGSRACDADVSREVVGQLASILNPGIELASWSGTPFDVCSDCPTTTLTIRLRDRAGQPSISTYRWKLLSYDEVPDLAKSIYSALRRVPGRLL